LSIPTRLSTELLDVPDRRRPIGIANRLGGEQLVSVEWMVAGGRAPSDELTR
jgi:hypothetical protein